MPPKDQMHTGPSYADKRESRPFPLGIHFSRSSTEERRDTPERKYKTQRYQITPSPEQDGKLLRSPRPFSWASRDARGLGGADPKQNETKLVLKVGDLIKLQTASPAYTLMRLGAIESQLKLNDTHRAHLLETARFALQVSYGEFDRVRDAARQRTTKGGGSDREPTIQFADVRDLQTYASTAKLLTEELDNSLSNFGVFQGVSGHYGRVAERLSSVIEEVGRGGAEAEIMEIRWAVERKCMYWADVDMMDAQVGEGRLVGGASQRPRRHSR